jgi:L-asparaginase
MARALGRVVVLGTGGTIAGAAASATDNVGYAAAQRSVQSLLAAVPALGRFDIEAEQVAQVDSKDMDHAIWAALARRCAAHLARPEVAGLVITHGTDTLEETAWLLHRVLGHDGGPAKPVVLTAAMRPATSLQADGPQNLLDAVTVAAAPGARGVVVSLAGQVWAGAEVRKVHTWRLEAFAAGDAGPVALLREGRIETLRPWPQARALRQGGVDEEMTGGGAHGLGPEGGHAGGHPDGHDGGHDGGHEGVHDGGHEGVHEGGPDDVVPAAAPAWPAAPAPADLPDADDDWPWVEIVTSHGGARPRAVEGWCAAGVRGLVVAATGNGTVHAALESALAAATQRGVPVLRASRCAAGGIVPAQGTGTVLLESARHLTPAQARVELMLRLLARRR